YRDRYDVTLKFCERLARRWASFDRFGHPLEIGHSFQESALAEEMASARGAEPSERQIPLLAALLCCAPFDIALYDAYGNLHGIPALASLNETYCSSDLSCFLQPATDGEVAFGGKYPADFMVNPPAKSLAAWHLVGGLDPLSMDELTGDEPDDGHPVLLSDWIKQDGLDCLKIKLRGADSEWDHERLVKVGEIALSHGVQDLTADFNCTVHDPSYVIEILDKLARETPEVYERLLYIEQPFPYDLEKHQIDVREVSARKPLLMDESAHNWQLVRLGRSLGWNGVALKTCKTLTGALLSLCWAKAHGMHLMVQDLTNPMLAQLSHLTFAAYIDTLRGVETNGMQFYPDASSPEAAIHPDAYRRRDGKVDISTLDKTGFGYRVGEIARELPEPAVSLGLTA
ncbi:MAG: enolase C-terminal domain-like protein, partial [Planctomycetota bacterium]